MTHKNPQQAFDAAITAGRLSDNPTAPNYAGHYMYMGTEGTRDLFKHRDTREYLRDAPTATPAAAAHTPGPWRIITQTPYGTPYPIHKIFGKTENGHDRYITEINLISDELAQEEKANARLIAAAPDMLAALEDLFTHCAMVHKHWGDNSNQKEADAAIKAARAAIAKAKGA